MVISYQLSVISYQWEVGSGKWEVGSGEWGDHCVCVAGGEWGI